MEVLAFRADLKIWSNIFWAFTHRIYKVSQNIQMMKFLYLETRQSIL